MLGWAFQQARRIGESIDPDAVANAEQAWKVRGCLHQRKHRPIYSACVVNFVFRPAVVRRLVAHSYQTWFDTIAPMIIYSQAFYLNAPLAKGGIHG